MNQKLWAFFSANGPDDQGRTLNQIIVQDDEWWEKTHDFIQWVLPTDEKSRFNKDAPLVDDEIRWKFFDGFHEDFASSDVRYTASRNIEFVNRRFLKFLGLSPFQPEGAVDNRERLQTWLTPSNHNLLRISRLLRCRSLLFPGDPYRNIAGVDRLFNQLDLLHTAYPEIITDKVWWFWKKNAQVVPSPPIQGAT